MKTKKIEINKSLDIFFLFSLTSASLNDIILDKILTIEMYCWIYYIYDRERERVLGWPKSLFGLFCKMVWKNRNELFGQPHVWVCVCVCKRKIACIIIISQNVNNHSNELWVYFIYICVCVYIEREHMEQEREK